MSGTGPLSTVRLSSLSFSKGIPRVIVMVISLLMLRQMGLSVAQVTTVVALCYVPWVLKCWWKPWMGRLMGYRWWVVVTQFLLSAVFMAMAFTIASLPSVVTLLLLTAWLTAIHNVAADGLSSSAVSKQHHHLTRELSRKFALVVGQGVLVMLAGNLQVVYRHDMLYSWRVMFFLLAGLFLLLCFWHALTINNRCEAIAINHEPLTVNHEPLTVSRASLLAFLFLYPFAQGMVDKASILFLVDAHSQGGLGLSPQEFGLVMGTVGIIGLTVGGIAGMNALRRWGAAACRWPMALSMLVPAAVYVAFSYSQPELLPVGLGVLIAQLAYGFGFAAYLLALRHIAWREQGKSVMAFSLLLGCLLSGPLLTVLDYDVFFLLALLLSGLSPLAVCLLRKIPMQK